MEHFDYFILSIKKFLGGAELLKRQSAFPGWDASNGCLVCTSSKLLASILVTKGRSSLLAGWAWCTRKKRLW